jgi:hypothetical protein
MHGQGRNACSCKVDLTEIRFHETCNHVKAGGFARAIGSEQADYLSCVYMKGDVRDNGSITELFSEMLNRKLCCQFGLLLRSGVNNEVDSIVLGAVTLNLEKSFCQIVTERLTLIGIGALG